jgi:hypothetical protein
VQRELVHFPVGERFGVLVEQLRQLNERCAVLKKLLRQEALDTN